MTAGLLSKAERGELALALPTGLVRTDGVVTKHPNTEVQQRIDLIFDTFLEQKSVAQTVRWFIKNKLLLPRRDRHGDIHWKRVTAASISCFLNNPAYAGAAAYGRTRWKRSENTGTMQGIKLPRNEWRFCVKDKFPAYISWETYEKIQTMLHDNYAEYDRNKTRGVPREGKALLHGITYCGECGHKMCVQYKGGTQYLCNHLKQQTGAPVCQRIPGDAVDDQVVAWFFETLSVAEIDIAADALHTRDAEHEKIVAARKQQVERLRYESQLAERQFTKSDPDNRLVTNELERRWEESLRQLKDAEQQLAEEEASAPSYFIPDDVLEMLQNVGPKLPELWNAKLLKTSQKKSLLRSLIDKVVIHRLAPDQVQTRVVWRGGATTSDVIRITVGKFEWLTGAKEMEKTIEKLARQGVSDKEIAEQLTNAGHRSPRAPVVLESTVQIVRLRKRILRENYQSHPRRVDGYLTVPQLTKKLSLPPHWIYDRIKNGTIAIEKDDSTGSYLFPDKTKTVQQIRKLRDGEIDRVDYRKGHQDD